VKELTDRGFLIYNNCPLAACRGQFNLIEELPI